MSHATIDGSPVPRPYRSRLQVLAGRALAEHPHRLELRGRPRSLAWPPVCANCGAPAAERITVRKAFARPRFDYRRWRRPELLFAVTAAPVPVCADCAGRHRAAVQPRSRARWMLSFVRTPLLIPFALQAAVLVIALRALRHLPFDAQGGRVVWGLLALLALSVLWGLVCVWLSTRPKRLVPQTDVTRACDFSDDVSHFFEGARHIWAMRDPSFAEAFAAANRDRVWTAADDARSGRHMRAITAVVGAVAVVVWLWVCHGP